MVGIEAWYAGVHIRAVSNVMHEGKNIGSIEVLLTMTHLEIFINRKASTFSYSYQKIRCQHTKVRRVIKF